MLPGTKSIYISTASLQELKELENTNNGCGSNFKKVVSRKIVDLKAELFRKEEEFTKKKLKQGYEFEKFSGQSKGSKTLDKISALTGKKKAPKSKSHETAAVSVCEQDDQNNKEYEKAKACLEAKAKLYKKMAAGETEDHEDDHGESRYLVDFHKKAIYQTDVRSEDEEERLKDEDIPKPSCPEDEWVEFVDSFGRDRKCLRRDLEKFKELDSGLKVKRRSPSPPTLMSEDMRREMMRQKWEKEQEEMMRNPEDPIHYENIRFDEVRDHGVGYFQFSKSETERQAQMELLDKLREQTVEQRNRYAKLKEKRQAALDARLAKVRQRKLQKQGLSESTTEASSLDEKNISFEQNKHLSHLGNEKDKQGDTQEYDIEKLITEARLATVDNKEPPPSSSGKESTLERFQAKRPKRDFLIGTKSWLDSKRDDRDPDFAPPSFYYNSDKKGRKRDKT